jgi:hypothetical protein
LSYVAFGTAAAPGVIHGDRLGAALGAFFLAVGIGAHALDELNGRPLQTMLGRGLLIVLGALGVLGGVAVGVVGIVVVSPLLAPLVVLGGLIAPAYNLELLRGRFHSDFWFAFAWGAFPAFTGYFVQTLTVRPAGVAVAGACFLLTVVQRRLSTPVRELRRRTVEVSGEQRLTDGTVLPLDHARLAAPLEGALSSLWLALVLLAVGLLVTRF